jgi:hypothetical protein
MSIVRKEEHSLPLPDHDGVSSPRIILLARGAQEHDRWAGRDGGGADLGEYGGGTLLRVFLWVAGARQEEGGCPRRALSARICLRIAQSEVSRQKIRPS